MLIVVRPEWVRLIELRQKNACMKLNTKRINIKTSRTAEMTCVSRAASYFEKIPQYKSDDYIAPKLVPLFIFPLLKVNAIRRLCKNRLSPKGIYEYVIARTKFIDTIFRNAIINGFDQAVIFGAGFDSRGIRFLKDDSTIKVFELDVPVTQTAKINQLRKRKIPVNKNIIFIPINFDKESFRDKLIDSGFNKKKRSLFILEGLIMYLNREAVDSTFKTIGEFAGISSEIVFDYIYASVLRRENLYFGESETLDIVSKANEAWIFGIEKGEIETFLRKYNFRLIENNDSEDLENKYFRNEQGRIVARINGTHCIAYAKK